VTVRTVTVVPVGDVPGGRIHHFVERLESELGLPVKVCPEGPDPALAYDAHRSQYRSDLLLHRLAGAVGGGGKVLGVTDLDLFIPVLTFVFGEAQLNGRAALISTYRLRSEMYGLPPDPDLLMERLIKEALHELGHTRGLLHCYHTGCVMQPSTYAELIDLKPARFCDRCQALWAG
jgi:archaemetzincin